MCLYISNTSARFVAVNTVDILLHVTTSRVFVSCKVESEKQPFSISDLISVNVVL